jgi:hypothetical protein
LSARQCQHGERIACPAPFRTPPTDLQITTPLAYGTTYRGVLKRQDALEQGQTPGYLTPPLDVHQWTVLVLPELNHLILEPLQPVEEPLLRRDLYS